VSSVGKISGRRPDSHRTLGLCGPDRISPDQHLSVIGEGPLAPKELADRLDYDESTVRRYPNELVDFGLLQKSQLKRESGGYVNGYHSIDLQEMREEILVGFYAWAGEAAALIEEANLTEEEYIDADDEEGLTDVFWEEFSDDEPTD